MSELIKISELTLGTPDETDVIPFVDVSANATKKALRSTLKGEQGEKGEDGTSFQIKGQLDNVGQLPSTGNETGDGYFVGETKILYYWDINDTWVNYGSLQGVIGPQGIQGIQGDPGLDGTDGVDGDSAYVYIAYASDSDGTDFTTTFNADLNYIAILSTDTEIASPQASDFAGLWKNYKGVAGTNGSNGTSLLSKGAYNAETTYSPYDFVLYNGSSYVCILESLDNLPTNTTYWQLMAQIGASITSGEFVEDDLVFTKDDATTVTIENAKIDLKGEQGEQGVTGATGANGTSFIWEDAYVAETTYAPNDVVSYNGSSYICILESTGNLPTNTTYWSLMAQKGTDGEGAGDMLASVYDPEEIEGDAFDMDNMVQGTNNKFVSAAELTVLQNTSNTNTGDQESSDFDIKDLTDSTSLRSAWSAKIANVVDDTTPQLGGQLDINGNAIGDGTLELLKFSETASAVNEFTIKNAATGSAPELQSTGDDTNIDLKLVPKGTGIVKGELHTATFVLKDKDTSLAIGTGIGGDFRIPGNRAITVKSVGAYTDTASATGSNKLTIDINEAGTSILSTKITLDVGEKTSQTAATAPVISDASIAADAIITFDIDQVNETTPDKGLKVYIEFIYT